MPRSRDKTAIKQCGEGCYDCGAECLGGIADIFKSCFACKSVKACGYRKILLGLLNMIMSHEILIFQINYC